MLRTETLLHRHKPQKILEWLFLVMAGVYLLAQCLHNATYVMPAYSFPDRTQFTRILSLTAILVLLKADLSGDWNMRIPLLVLTSCAFFMAYRTGRELFLLMIPVMMIGMAGMDYHRILRVYSVVLGIFLLVTFLCSFTGVIPNLVYYQDGQLRSSWGIAYPTDLASFVLFFVMISWLAWEKLPDLFALLGAAASFLLSWKIADSRTSELCSLILAFFVILKVCLDRRDGKNGERGAFEKGLHLMLAGSFLLFALVFFVSITLYARGGELGITLNHLLSNRLRMALSVYQDQGIHPFGSNYAQVGMGGNTLYPYGYYFIDSSYPMILIRYGWVLFLAVGALWTGLGLRAYGCGNRKLLFVMAIIAFHALSEHHFLDLAFNFLLVLPFSEIKEQTDSREQKSLKQQVGDYRGLMVLSVLGITAVITAGARSLSRLRTVFDIWGVETSRGEMKAAAWCALLICSVIGLCFAACSLGRFRKEKKWSSWSHMLLLLVCAGILCGAVVCDSRVIRSAAGSSVLADEEVYALKILADSADGIVTVEELPELANEEVPGLKPSFWYGDDLARMSPVSVAVSLREDRQRFADKNFMFTQISDDKAVYSNDQSAIKALKEAGYAWTDYDAAVRNVDLGRMAEQNGLELSEAGTIILSDGDGLNNGPDLDLFHGGYQVHFELRTDPALIDATEGVCTLRVVGHGNGTVLAEKSVDWDEFDQNGRADAELDFDTTESRMTQFMVFPADNVDLEVLEIRYQKVQK